MEEVNQNLPLRIKDQTCRHVPPHQKLPKSSFPLRKKAIFFQTPWKYFKDQRRRRSHPLRNDVQGSPQKISSLRGVWILNGMAQNADESQLRARGRNGKSISQTTVTAIQGILHGIRFICGHLELPEHRDSYIEYR